MTDTYKKNLIEYFYGIRLEEPEHKYYVGDTNIKKSVSTLIKDFHKKFDREGKSRQVAKREGIPQEELLKIWDAKKDKACRKGTETHLFGELYPFNRNMEPRNKFEEAIVKFWSDMPDTIVPVTMELEMYHKRYWFAGTADIILFDTVKNVFIIADYKTNEALFKNFRDERMYSPFRHLLKNNYNKYQLQLSFYQILFEQTGYKVGGRKIVWLRPSGKYQMYDTNDYTKELSTYLKNNKVC